MIWARIGTALVASLILLATAPGANAQGGARSYYFWPFWETRPPAPPPRVRRSVPRPEAPEAPLPGEPASADDTAHFLAGMPLPADSQLAALTREGGWQSHANAFNAAFANFDKRQASRIRAWSSANLKSPQPVLFYMFSGPDFLYANAFFPEASTYVLAGLEPVGPIPDLRRARGSVSSVLGGIRASTRTVLSYSFFITKNMKSELHTTRLSGTLPILYVFLARSGKTIREASLVHVNDKGELQMGDDPRSAARGAKIVFTGSEGKEQTLYYFSTNIADDGFRRSGFAQFCEGLGQGDSFIKSASYLMHGGGFTRLRSFMLEHSATIVQDDTGIPVTYFDTRKWDLQAFGHYLGPIGIFPGRYQPRLSELHRRGRPLDFGLGYRWRANETSLLLAVKKEPAVSGTTKGAAPTPQFTGSSDQPR